MSQWEDPDARRGTPWGASGPYGSACNLTRRPGSPSDDRRGARHGRASGNRGARPGRRGPDGRRQAGASLPGVSVAELIATRRPSFSFEFFPPRDDGGVDALFDTMRELKYLEPAFVSV